MEQQLSDDYYVEPTCQNYHEFNDDGPGIDYDNQVFVFYTFNDQRWVLQGWLCKDKDCPMASRGEHLVPEFGTGAVLFLETGHIKNWEILTTEELIKSVEA